MEILLFTKTQRGGSEAYLIVARKHALRALSQSMARELGPLGVHVAHVIVDGAIDTPWVRETFPEMAADRGARDGLLDPDAIAENYLNLVRQPRSTWTHELDLRPYCESW